MKVKTVYQCEKCGEEYSSRNECESCEKNHSAPVRIMQRIMHYRSPLDTGDFHYPVKLWIEMDDGTAIPYYSERSIEALERYKHDNESDHISQ